MQLSGVTQVQPARLWEGEEEDEGHSEIKVLSSRCSPTLKSLWRIIVFGLVAPLPVAEFRDRPTATNSGDLLQ